MPTEILIRLATNHDASLLPAIEKSAGEAFRSVPRLEWIADDDVVSAEIHQIYIDEGTVWLAELDKDIVGFVTCRAEFDDGALHIVELGVEARHQGRGIGRKLMDATINYAKTNKLPALTLTTFRELAFNELFYHKLGFQTLDRNQTPKRLRATLNTEADNGLPADRRCAMRMLL